MREAHGGSPLNEDFLDLLRELVRTDVDFLVVGAYAMAVHGVPRATGDLDVWIDRSPANAERTWTALERFGAPAAALGVTREDLTRPGMVVQIGLPPRRIDLMTDVTGLDFATARKDRVTHDVGGVVVPFLGRDSLIRNKRATNRPRDRVDLELLERGGRAE